MSRSIALGLVLLIGAFVLLAVWFARAERGSIAVGESASFESARPESQVELLSAEDPALADGGSTRDEGGAARRSIPRDDRVPISGRIVVAGGYPADAQARVRGEVYLGRVNQGNVQTLTTPVARDGSFVLLVPHGARYALLDLESGMFTLKDYIKALPGETDVVLEPAVYAVIRGGIVPPFPLATRGLSWNDVSVSCSQGLDERSVVPDGNGVFEVGFLPVGCALELSVQNPLGPAWAQHVEPLATAEVRTIRVALELGITIAGRVLDEQGQPMEGVEIQTASDAAALSRPARVRYGPSTDADGRFELTGLGHGTYELAADSSDLARGAEVSVDATAGDVRDLELSVVRGSCIEGTVRWPDGRPAASFEVSATQGTTNCSSSGKGGHFRLCALLEGTYEIAVQADRPGIVGQASAHEIRTGETALELVLDESPSYPVQGTVVDEKGSPLRDFTVSSQGEHQVQRSSSAWIESFRASGTFRLSGLLEGEATIRVQARGYMPVEQHVVVGPSAPGPLHFVLTSDGRSHGQVLDARK